MIQIYYAKRALLIQIYYYDKRALLIQIVCHAVLVLVICVCSRRLLLDSNGPCIITPL